MATWQCPPHPEVKAPSTEVCGAPTACMTRALQVLGRSRELMELASGMREQCTPERPQRGHLWKKGLA